jgi:hypothetical protein
VLCLIPGASADEQQKPASSQQIMATLLANEEAAAQHKNNYAYLSHERSDRTGGHLWTEKVVETKAGNVKMLLAEDGKPLSPQRIAQERGRLAAIVADPASFKKKAQAEKDDEASVLPMLKMVTKAFVFGEARDEGGYLRIDYTPNPSYQPRSIEERVLHRMSGMMLIDPQTLRLHRVEARLPQDFSIGYGLVAIIHAGSSLTSTRERGDGADWKMTSFDLDVNGRVFCFKTIARKAHGEHTNLVRVPNDLTIAQAVALVEQ